MSAFVVCLRDCVRPSAILRLVIAEWIDPIKRMFRRTRSKVFQEGEEVISPLSADRHALFSIMPVATARRRVTARDHRSPRPILGSVDSGHFFILAMQSGAIGFLVAAAALRVTAQQIFAVLQSLRTTVASAFPKGAAAFWRATAFENSQLAEASPCQLGEIRTSHSLHLRALLFSSQTTAAFGRISQACARHFSADAAIATTNPTRRMNVWNAGADNQPPEPLPNKVLESIRHFINISNNSLQLGVYCS